jgi:transcriptional regulator with XRE-family HTH domain
MLKDKVKKIRKEMGMSQKDFAALLGISRSYVGDIETGKSKGSNIKIISKIANVSGNPIEYFLSDEEMDEMEIKPYDILDAAIESLIEKNLINEEGQITNDIAKEMLIGILEKEIQLKVKLKNKK